MADLTITASRVGFQDADTLLEKVVGPAGEAIDAGEAVRLDTTTGKFVKANATTAANARAYGVAARGANVANMPITVVRKGLLDLGDALGGLAYDADVYLSDTSGALADAAGTVSKVVGTVVPAFGHTTADKLLRVDL